MPRAPAARARARQWLCRRRRHLFGTPRFDTPASKAHIRQQRAAIWAWFRGLGGNLIKCVRREEAWRRPRHWPGANTAPPASPAPLPARNGVNLTKVALPVELCEPRSFLSRLTDSWAYLDLLHAAADARCARLRACAHARGESGRDQVS